jgi:hypothetical protein
MEVVFECIGLDIDFKFTEEFDLSTEIYHDQRSLTHSKRKQKAELDEYIQVFQSKYGFISNLSILDLLFNKGPATSNYLESQKLLF